MEQQEIINKTQYPDSVEIGTPGKAGALKIYFNASNKEESEQRVTDACAIKAKALEEYNKITN